MKRGTKRSAALVLAMLLGCSVIAVALWGALGADPVARGPVPIAAGGIFCLGALGALMGSVAARPTKPPPPDR